MGRILIVNGNVFTCDPRRPWAQAVAVTRTRVVAVGADSDVRAFRDGAEVIDVEGGTVLPGFIDAHNHYLATGESMSAIDVRFPEVRSIADLVRVIAAACRQVEPGVVVRAFGYDDAKYERMPTRWDLDEAARRNPVLVGHVSGHDVLANSLAIDVAGVSTSVPVPDAGIAVRDDRGRLTGVFKDAACALVEPIAVDIGHHGPNFHVAATQEQLVSAIETAGQAFVAAGLTTVCDAQVTRRELHAYIDARRQGRLPLRTVCMPLSHQLGDYEAVGMSGAFGDDWLSLGPMKFYCDGSLIGGTAAFIDPDDAPADFEGVLFWDPGELSAEIERAHRDGWQLGVHAQGDRAIGIVLDAYERAQDLYPVRDPRFRIEHCGLPTPEHLERMRVLGAALVAQPSYLRDSGDDFLRRLPRRAHRLQPLRSALDAGVHVVLSSDSDVASYRPLDTIAAAVLRTTISGRPIGRDQALSVAQAVRCHTIEAARAIRAEANRGSIEVGKLADLVVTGPLFDCDPRGLRDVPISLTIIGGRVVHRTH